MNSKVRSMVIVVGSVALLAGMSTAVRGFAQPSTLSQLEARVRLLEAQPPIRDANGSLDRDTSYAFAPGTTDTVSVMKVEFLHGPFTEPPVVTATPRVMNKHSDWIGGSKDSFTVTIYDLTEKGFTALLRRVDPTGKPITEGVMLDWIAVSRFPKSKG